MFLSCRGAAHFDPAFVEHAELRSLTLGGPQLLSGLMRAATCPSRLLLSPVRLRAARQRQSASHEPSTPLRAFSRHSSTKVSTRASVVRCGGRRGIHANLSVRRHVGSTP